MKELISKRERLARKKYRTRQRIRGTKSVPRLSVSKSNTSLYCQIIDDVTGITLCGIHSKTITKGASISIKQARELGNLIAKAAQDQSIQRVVFDRRGRKYTGRVAAVAEGARESGLKI